MFQKCPKCNGSGLTEDNDRFSSAHWKQCPVCLGEFVIHEEQRVPPSKVKQLIHFDKDRIVAKGCDLVFIFDPGKDAPEKPLCSCIKDVCLGLKTYTCKYPKT